MIDPANIVMITLMTMVAMILYETTTDTTLFLMKTFPH